MNRDFDAVQMRRALELARRGRGTTWPNPMVGAVVVRDGRVVGEGYHRIAGGPHAEVEALQAVDGDPAGATLVVNLEPCSHHARTGPCAELVADARLRRVVIGTLDPNPEVRGRGAAVLRDAGIEVTVGSLAGECTALNEVYFTGRRFGRPHITIKSATDLFGRTSTRAGDSQWITGEEARRHGHEHRAVTQAIAVGSGTVLADDCRLTARMVSGDSPSPIRVLFDSRLRVPAGARLFADDGVQVLVYATEPAIAADAAGRLPGHIEVIPCGSGPRVDLAAAMADLYAREVVAVLVEGGATLAGALVDAGLFDVVVRYVAARVIGGDVAPGPLRGNGVEWLRDTPTLEFVSVVPLGPDLVITARRPLEVPCSQV